MSDGDKFLRCKVRKGTGHKREVLDAEHTVLRKGPPHRVLRLSAWWLEGCEGHAPPSAPRSASPLPLELRERSAARWSPPLPGLAPGLRVISPGPALNGAGGLPLRVRALLLALLL